MENISLNNSKNVQNNKLANDKKGEVFKKNEPQVSEELKNKAKNMVGAMSLAAMTMGGMAVSSCSTEDYLGDNIEQTNPKNVLDLVNSDEIDDDYIYNLRGKNAGQRTNLMLSNLLGLQSNDKDLTSGMGLKTNLISSNGDTVTVELDKYDAKINGKRISQSIDGGIDFDGTMILPVSKEKCVLYEYSVPKAILSRGYAMTRAGGADECIVKTTIAPNGQLETETYTLDSQNSVSALANNFRKANTSLKRLDVLREELGIGTGNNPLAYDIYGVDQKCHNPITYTINEVTPEKVLISAVQVDYEHTASGVEFVSEVTSGSDGSLNIKRTATGGDLSGDTHGPAGFDHKGAVENISIKANDDGSFIEEKVDANGDKTTYTIAKDDEGYYRIQDGTSVKERIATESRAVPIEFIVSVEDWEY